MTLFLFFIEFSSSAGLRQHYKRQDSCKTTKIYQRLPSITSDGPGTMVNQHLQLSTLTTTLLPDTSQDGRILKEPTFQQTIRMPCNDEDGVITHVDETGTETTLFLDPSYSQYKSGDHLLLQSNTPGNANQLGISAMHHKYQITSSLTSPHNTSDNKTDSFYTPLKSPSPISTTQSGPKEISVPTLEASFPFHPFSGESSHK